MPSSSEHREKADRNFAALTDLDYSRHPEWAAVIAFYRAVHLIERLGAIESPQHHSGDHAHRALFIRRRHRPIAVPYNALRTASETARYGTLHQFETAFPGEDVKTVLIDVHLAAIDSYVTARFPPTGGS